MGCFKLPNVVCNQIESLTRRLIHWGDTQEKKIYWLGWEKLSTSKKRGGLGFRITEAFNRAFLAKQYQRLANCNNSLMTQVLKAKYLPYSRAMEAKHGLWASFTRTSIHLTKDIDLDGHTMEGGK